MKKKHGKLFKAAVFVLIAILFLGLIVLVTRKRAVAPETEKIPPVVVRTPEYGNLAESVTISGYVEAKAMIPVVPFVAGTIMEYQVKAGYFVNKDSLVARIDDAPFRQQMLQAQAAYFAAKSTFDRVENLFKSGASTQQNYDSAKAQRDAAKAQYDLAMLQMDYTMVKAPVSGTILIADSAVGGIGTTTQPVAVMADLTDLVVRLKVPEKYFDLFQMNLKNLSVQVIRPGESGLYGDAVTSASIENIAPYISPESKNFQLVCRLDSPGERFRPGMFVKVKVSYSVHENVPLLPVQTLKLDGTCYIYDGMDGTVKFIDPGRTVSDGNNFIVPEEYAGASFVVDGQHSVFDGQKVKLVSGDDFEAL